MNSLEELRRIKEEVNDMPFSYENLHRLMHLAYISDGLFKASSTVPNKEIALHQINRIQQDDFKAIIKSANKTELKVAFQDLLNSFKIVLDYL